MSEIHTPATIQYLTQVAKDWARHQFAAADGADFDLEPQRFELDGGTVKRQSLPAHSLEAVAPLKATQALECPSAWVHPGTATITVAAGPDRVELDHETVEVTAVDCDAGEIACESALVARFGDLPPCLGAFGYAA